MLLLVGICCAPLHASSDPYSSEYEQSPSPEYHISRKGQLLAEERQEQFRKRISVQDAVGQGVPLTPVAQRRLENELRVDDTPARTESSRFAAKLAAIVLLCGILALRTFGNEFGELLNRRRNPWARKNLRKSSSAKLRAAAHRANDVNPTLSSDPTTAVGESAANPTPPELSPAGAFLVHTQKRLGELRRLLRQIGRTTLPGAKRRPLTELRRQVRLLRTGANLPELRPVYQLTLALEGLLKQFGDRANYVTPSSLRTVAGGLDLLEELCAPGVRTDLLNDPPLRILAVDDDPLSLSAVCSALKRALPVPDLAGSSEAALALTTQQAYDVIFLDVLMPGVDGFDLCRQIHGTAANAGTPVVYITALSDFQSWARSILSGGSDLIGKPFLSFEIMVKAITLAARRRLQRNQQPAVESICKGAAATAVTVSTAAGHADESLGGRGNRPTPASRYTVPVTATTTNPTQLANEATAQILNETFLARASAAVGGLRELSQTIFQTRDASTRQELLADFYLQLHPLTLNAATADAHPALRLCGALQGLIKKLLESPDSGTPSTLMTIASSVELLEDLCRSGIQRDAAFDSPVRMLIVDDDPVARRALDCALQMNFGRPESVDGGEAALKSAAQNTYDVIFLDVQMPDLDGFTVCSRIHETAANRTTPVVFVTVESDLTARSQATVSGGSDLVGKPFLTAEVTLKALTFALRGRLEKSSATHHLASVPDDESTRRAELDVVAA